MKAELLAPAGGWLQLEAALRFGADAIYIGCKQFGMRQRASNFRLSEVIDVVSLVHSYGARLYVTLNTIMYDDDFSELAVYMHALCIAGVDAFIVSDLGAASLAKRYAPQVSLHVSTQASVSNAQAASVWHHLGAKRVVCAREMSLEQITRMCAEVPADLEVEAFVHGSMCMAISGRCLLSAQMTDRSADKGRCAQPCRWNYALNEQKRSGEFYPIEQDGHGTYIMNAYDLNMIAHLDDLKQAGVHSFKIEGRNKKAFYVATVVHAYRSVLDGAAVEDYQEELLTISHRPYGTGFYYGAPHQALLSDGYEQSRLHAATVSSCDAIEGELFRITVICFNRFAQGSQLEVLSPFEPIRTLEVKRLAWIPKGRKDRSPKDPVTTLVANRSTERYSFVTDLPLKAGDFLRIAC